MAGHSQFKNIMHRKGAQDARRSKLFSKLAREITVSAKQGLPDPEKNPKLRAAIIAARKENMPKDNIERAIKKAAGGGEADYVEVTYEGYAPGGVAVFVDASTNNVNRTVGNVRSYFTKCESNLGTNGSLAHVFERKGEFVIENAALKGRDGDEFEMELIDAGADDVLRDEEGFTVLVPFQGFGAMQQKLDQLGVESKSAELKRFPLTTIPADLTTARNVMRLIDMLNEDDDVNAVFHNMELTEEVEAALAEG